MELREGFRLTALLRSEEVDMTDQEMQRYDECVSALEEIAAGNGGRLSLLPGGNGTVMICGDRAGLLRLATAMLRYTVDAGLVEAGSAPFRHIPNWFQAESDCTGLVLKIAKTPAPRPSKPSRAYRAGAWIRRLLRSLIRRRGEDGPAAGVPPSPPPRGPKPLEARTTAGPSPVEGKF